MSNFVKSIDSSFINAILISLFVFSITLAASAALIDRTGKAPALMIDLYKLAIEKDYRFLSYGDAMLLKKNEI